MVCIARTRLRAESFRDFLSFHGTRQTRAIRSAPLSLITLRLGRDSHRECASCEWVTGRNGTERHIAAWRGALRFFSRSSSRARDSREVRAESDGGRLNVMCLFLRRRYSHGQLPQTLACMHARAYVISTYIWTYVAGRARVFSLTRLADVRHNLFEMIEIDPNVSTKSADVS